MTAPRATLYPYRLALRRPLRTGRGTITHRRGLLVCLDLGGYCGWGEAAPLPGWPGRDLATTADVLRRWLCSFNKDERQPLPSELSEMAIGVAESMFDVPCAAAALGTALDDLISRHTRDSLRSYMVGGQPTPAAVPVSTLLAGETPAEIAETAASAVAAGFGTLKLKVGDRPLVEDLSRLEALRAVAPDIPLRLDANGAWGAEAAEALAAVATFEPEFVEEPCHGLENLRRLQATTGVPLAADESLPPADPRFSYPQVGLAAAVLKPSAVGDPMSVVRIGEELRNQGTEVVVGSFLESAVGVTMAAHVAAALGGPAAGLDTSGLLESDVCEPPAIVGGEFLLPEGPGLGVAPDPARLGAPLDLAG